MKNKILTMGDIFEIENRVNEIEQILELCDQGRDGDVIDNLIAELDDIESTLRYSITAIKRSQVNG